MIQVDKSEALHGDIKLPLNRSDIKNAINMGTAKYSTESYEFMSQEIPPQEGWHQNAGGRFIACSPVVGDVDNDGFPEIVCCNSQGKLYVWNHKGNILSGWPKNLWTTTPALADLDNDGDLEIITLGFEDSSGVYIWQHDGTNFSANWPQYMEYSTYAGATSSPSIGDINGDGDWEIITVFRRYPYTGPLNIAIYVWNLDGSLINDNWPIELASGQDFTTYSTPCLADVNNDGKLDIIQITSDTGSPNSFTIHILNENGNSLSGWPRTFTSGAVAGSPVAGDLNGDGLIEIVVASSGTGTLYVLDSEGNPFNNNWPYVLIYSLKASAALGDLDEDGDLEIIVKRNNHMIYAFQHDSADLLPGWPQDAGRHHVFVGPNLYSSPIIGDMDGDEAPEIIVCGTDSDASPYPGIYAWHANGSLVDGWPLKVGCDDYTYAYVNATPCGADLDGDGDIEVIVAGRDGIMYSWDNPGIYNPFKSEWPTFQHDTHHTGKYSFRTNGAGVENNFTNLKNNFVLYQNYPNPFNSETSISYSISKYAKIEISIYSIRGQKIKTLLNGYMPEGLYKITWYGNDNYANDVSSGVYLYKISSEKYYEIKKCILLK